MATAHYLVLKRMKHGAENFLPGEAVELDAEDKSTGILVQRGFLSVVPADYPAAVRTVGEAQPSSAASPTGDDNEDLADLLKLTRKELDAMAIDFGIENPEALGNKEEVAKAILEAEAKEEGGSETTESSETTEGSETAEGGETEANEETTEEPKEG